MGNNIPMLINYVPHYLEPSMQKWVVFDKMQIV